MNIDIFLFTSFLKEVSVSKCCVQWASNSIFNRG